MLKIQKEKISTGIVTYTKYGSGEPIILLPGWMSFIDQLKLDKYLKEHKGKYLLIALHLTNFYHSSISTHPYTAEDYCIELKEFIQKQGFKKVNLVGHSAGSRIAIHFANNYPYLVENLVLMSAAGLKHKNASARTLQKANYYFTKFKVTPIEMDILKQTFINIYDEDLTEKIKMINHPTLLIWGERDKLIKFRKAKIFNSLIKKSTLVSFKRIGHMTIKHQKVYKEIFNFLTKTADANKAN